MDLRLKKKEWAGKRVWIVGLGKSGLACAKVLDTLDSILFLSDGKDEAACSSPLLASILDRGHTVQYQDLLEKAPENLDWIILSPGISPELPIFLEQAEQGVKIIGEIELAYLLNNENMIVGITGTNGKTTTTTLVKEIFVEAGLDALAVGNIGLPLLTGMEQGKKTTVFVTELSSFQLETTQNLRVNIAAILNITPDHLDRHGDMENYAAAKARILLNQRPDDFAILNLDDSRIAAMQQLCRGKIIGTSMLKEYPDSVFLRDGWVCTNVSGKKERVVSLEKIRIPGMHNVENALVAVGCALAAGIKIDTIAKVLMEFPGVPHRLENVGNLKGVNFINDSKGTNVDASSKALDAYQCPIVLIAGGKGKGASYASFAVKIQEKVSHVILIGQDATKIKTALEEKDYFSIKMAIDMEDAVGQGYKLCPEGGIVLLSPACASFDMYKNFEERGEVFTHCVKELIGKHENI